MRVFASLGIIAVLLFSQAIVVYAQIVSTPDALSISFAPEYPQPGQQVTATVSSAGESARSATIAWVLDGVTQQQERGGVSFTFLAGQNGSSQKLDVLLRTTSGSVLSKSVTIYPSELTLLWEAATYTPPFFRGASHYTPGSNIRAQAEPYFLKGDGSPYTNEELIYTWSKNGTVLGSQSGVGARSLVTEGPKFLGSYILSVEVRSPDGARNARSSARIVTQDPHLVLYERDPLIGVRYHDAILDGHIFRGSSQVEIQAVPYSMDTSYVNGRELSYTWRINNAAANAPDAAPSSLTIQLSSEKNLTTTIRVAVEHASRLLQAAEGVFRVTFEGSARDSLFGL